jgi:hypothetical protein
MQSSRIAVHRYSVEDRIQVITLQATMDAIVDLCRGGGNYRALGTPCHVNGYVFYNRRAGFLTRYIDTQTSRYTRILLLTLRTCLARHGL